MRGQIIASVAGACRGSRHARNRVVFPFFLFLLLFSQAFSVWPAMAQVETSLSEEIAALEKDIAGVEISLRTMSSYIKLGLKPPPYNASQFEWAAFNGGLDSLENYIARAKVGIDQLYGRLEDLLLQFPDIEEPEEARRARDRKRRREEAHRRIEELRNQINNYRNRRRKR